uniref:Integrase, catalytic region, zinc finger, CCHC-type, peptidase aspartic, catalytic n=1 Tax=Tanacetum cinerariifolium TaxID=118510 RepID=A0A6L2M9W2_TANCI|nr:integrase, catalytic region, zinc finger, CCHC-type, peptidase aspartic, catalytic [Tanacetum cinerariifolium]
MDSIIPLRQKNTLAEYMILSGTDNRPPMLDKDLYDSWKSQMELYMQNREHRRMILESVENGLPADIYSLVNHHRVVKYLWERVQLLMQGDDPIACLNKTMAFLIAVASSRFPSTNNQLRTSSNPRNQATIQDGRVTVRVVKCYNCQGEGHIARKCTQPKRPRNATWYKEKGMLAEAQEAGQILDEKQLAFLADSRVPDAVLMANISNYGSDVISEVPHFETYLNDMENQGVHAMPDFEQPPAVDSTDSEIYSDSNIILYSQYLQETQQENVQEKLVLKEQVDSLEQNLSKQIKEKECFLQTFTVFKSESKEKEDKYIENKIDLEKKIKEFDNILFKVGQSAQTMHMLTKPQTFNDNIHKQALVEVPSELPRVSLVNESLKKLKFYLAQFDSMVKKRTTPNARTDAKLQDKDTTICKLKDIVKSMREKCKEENVNYDYCEIETKNVELENSVAKVISENERLCNEINHVKQVFTEQFDSIKKTRVRAKEQSESLIDKLNLKSTENEDLKAQIQNKVFVITSLKNDLRKVKGKEIVDIAAQIPSANTIVPGMFKLDLESLAPSLLQNKKAHIDYLKYTQEQANILWEIVEQAKATQLLDKVLDFTFQVATAPIAVVLADSLVLTSIDQDAPSTSIPSTQEQEHSLTISQGFEESPKTLVFRDDPIHGSLYEELTSQGSSSNVRQTHTLFKHLGRWTKDHPIANMIDDPSRSVFARKKLKTDAMWCYFNAFLTSIEPKNFKQAMIEPSWIDAMQEEIHEFERLEV